MRQGRLKKPETANPTEQKVFLTVKKVVDKADPESLLKMGAPKDEYDTPSRYIAQAIIREGTGGLSRTQLANILALTFHLEFNMWGSPIVLHGLYFDVADTLLPLLPKIKR